MNRTFEHFPNLVTCPICDSSKDEPCFLVPIDGTTSGRNCEATPVHVSCITEQLAEFHLTYGKEIIYRRLR